MKKQQGFTLVELMVVISIISLFSSITLTSITSSRQKARDSATVTNLNQIKTALDLYYSNNGQYPPIPNPLTPAGYSAATPTANGSNSFRDVLNPLVTSGLLKQIVDRPGGKNPPNGYFGYLIGVDLLPPNFVYKCGNTTAKKSIVYAYSNTPINNLPVMRYSTDGGITFTNVPPNYHYCVTSSS